MTLLAAINWGSVADWVSGIGSISASGVALYLAGAEGRARREAERPIINVHLPDPLAPGWNSLRIDFENPGAKAWRATAIEIVEPSGGKVVGREKAIRTDGYGGAASDDSLRDAHAAKRIDRSVSLTRIGVHKSMGLGGGPGNFAMDHILVSLPDSARRVRLRVEMVSLEPVPDRFTTVIVRAVGRSGDG